MPSDPDILKVEEYVKNLLTDYESITIYELIDKINTNFILTTMDVNATVFNLLIENCIHIKIPNQEFEKSLVALNKGIRTENNDLVSRRDYPRIVVSLPPYDLFGLESEFQQINFPISLIEEEFRKMFMMAKDKIQICSPFLDYNGIERYLTILTMKVNEGVKIEILSRQIQPNDPDSRYHQMYRIFREFKGNSQSVNIRNYHYQSNKKIDSSTHAKMIICDSSIAYVGSGEIRTNSFTKNFEMGIVLRNSKAREISIIFNKIFSVSSPVQFGEDD